MELLKFYASWCGPCKLQTEHLKKITGVTIKEIDIEDENNNDLVEKYKIRSIPKIVILKNGEIIKEFVGLTSADKIQEVIDGVD